MSEKLPNGVDLDVIRQAYGWTVDYDWNVHALTAGDQGYEETGIRLDAATRRVLDDDTRRTRALGSDDWDAIEEAVAGWVDEVNADRVDRFRTLLATLKGLREAPHEPAPNPEAQP